MNWRPGGARGGAYPETETRILVAVWTLDLRNRVKYWDYEICAAFPSGLVGADSEWAEVESWVYATELTVSLPRPEAPDHFKNEALAAPCDLRGWAG